jgi:hypothetical protein
LADVTIKTRCEGDEQEPGRQYNLNRNGSIKSQSDIAFNGRHGCIVSATNLFSSVPVRHKIFKQVCGIGAFDSRLLVSFLLIVDHVYDYFFAFICTGYICPGL